MMNPETNRFEEVTAKRRYSDAVNSAIKGHEQRYRKADGSLAPKNATVFSIGEEIAIRGYVFKVDRFDGDEMVLKGVRPVNKYRKKPIGGSRGASKRKKKRGTSKRRG